MYKISWYNIGISWCLWTWRLQCTSEECEGWPDGYIWRFPFFLGYRDIPTVDGVMENPKAAYTVMSISTKYGFIQVGYISICHYVGICWLYLLSLFGFSPILQPVLWRALGSYSNDGRVLPGDGDDDGDVMLCFWTKETANASDANWHTWWFYPTYPTYN